MLVSEVRTRIPYYFKPRGRSGSLVSDWIDDDDDGGGGQKGKEGGWRQATNIIDNTYI